MKSCNICGEKEKIELVMPNLNGYVEGTGYAIFECKTCETSYIDTSKVKPDIYDKIYTINSVPGYDRYYNYIKAVMDSEEPLEYLSNQEPAYYLVKKALKDKHYLDILEVGCGYGYLSHALRNESHNVIGLDISNNAIELAKSFFGNDYICSSIEQYKPKKRFDCIVATELIEHLSDPKAFMKECSRLLKPDGFIVITTPNKSYCSNGSWQTDLPPVHTHWFTIKSLWTLGDKSDYFCEPLSYSRTFVNENKLLSYYLASQGGTPKPIMDKNYNTIRQRDSMMLKALKGCLYNPLSRNTTKWLHNILTTEQQFICMIFYNKKSKGL